jgi:hypothetical protein
MCLFDKRLADWVGQAVWLLDPIVAGKCAMYGRAGFDLLHARMLPLQG